MAKGKGKSGDKVAALDASPSHLLHRALQLALDYYAIEQGEAAITQRQYAVLAAAAEHEGATQADLVRITGIDRSTLADMAARMIAKGLLARERSTKDARANAVTLTETGRIALEDARPKAAAADARLLKLLSGGGKRTAFTGLLRDLVRAGEEAANPKPKAAKPPKAPKTPKAPKATKTKVPKAKKKLKKAA